MRLGYNDQKVQETLDLLNPQLVGVTVYSLRYQRAYSLIREIGNRADYKIVIGGPHISAVEAKPVFETGDFSRKERRKAYWTLHRLAEQDTSGKMMVSEKKCV